MIYMDSKVGMGYKVKVVALYLWLPYAAVMKMGDVWLVGRSENLGRLTALVSILRRNLDSDMDVPILKGHRRCGRVFFDSLHF